MPAWQVILLGLLEGLTEFIPVSSTGHLLLAGHFLGFQSPKKVFEVLIQLGAILAILSVYAGKLWHLLCRIRRAVGSRAGSSSASCWHSCRRRSRGYCCMGSSRACCLKSPALVCWMLILGGIVLLFMDRVRLEPRYHDVAQLPPRKP